MSGAVADSALTRWCRDALGGEPVKQLFVRQQMSASVGWRLADGRRVVVKSRGDPLARVTACLRLQAALFAERFPCPSPLTGAGIVGGLTVHAEEYVDGGEQMFGEDLTLAAPMAHQFAELLGQLERVRQVADVDVLVPPPWVSWWSSRPWTRQPHVPTFVYDAADRVRERMRAVYLPGVLGHADWESQNLRWVGSRLHVVFDWDSLTWAPEAVLVALAAPVFPATTQPETASIAGVAAFLEQYQLSRGREFSVDELEVAWAAGLLPSLHNARNEVLEGNRPLVLERLIDDCEDRLHLANA